VAPKLSFWLKSNQYIDDDVSHFFIDFFASGKAHMKVQSEMQQSILIVSI